MTISKNLKQPALAAFFVILLADVALLILGDERFRYFTKPLLMPAVMLSFIASIESTKTRLTSTILLALTFSWLGDLFLMFEANDNLYFILGLSSFLVAHLVYIVSFNIIRTAESIRLKPVFLFGPVIFYFVLLRLLSPHLSNMALPVYVYGAVICLMVFFALHLPLLRKPGWMILAGADLFLLSDSILAINKFYQPYLWAPPVIMITYGLAQWFIAKGVAVYVTGNSAASKQAA